MKTERLVALDRLPYGRKNLKRGAEFKASKGEAKVLVYVGKAARVKPAKLKKAAEIVSPDPSKDAIDGLGEPETTVTTQEPAPATTRRRTSRTRTAQVTQTK